MKALMSRLESGDAENTDAENVDAEHGDADAAPGTVLDDKLLVRCGDGKAVRLLTAQKPGAKAMDAQDLLRGLYIPAGARFE